MFYQSDIDYYLVMATLREVFTQNLKYYRKQKSITQEKLSELIDMSPSYINALETKAAFPQPEVIEKIADELGIPAYLLFKADACPEGVLSFNAQSFAEKLTDDLYEKLKKDMYLDILHVITEKRN